MGTAVEQWSTRHESYGPGWTAFYWNTWQAPHRMDLLRAMAPLAPASVLEVGANCGPNLRLFHTTLRCRGLGIDVNREAVTAGNRYLAAANIQTVHLAQGDLRTWLPALPDRSFDVVLACYALAYLHPNDLEHVMREVARIARVGLVLAEPMIDAQHGPGRIEARIPEYRHDYTAALMRTSPRAWTVTAHPLDPIDALTACLVARAKD